MSRLDVEFMDETCGFVSVNEDIIEQKILERIKNHNYDNLTSKEYEQLSPKRKNVLEWYSFEEGKKILELGAGMGALTELFVERKCLVTSVEIKHTRTQIIEERLKDYGQVQIICENPVLYETEEKYDYVIIHDIWGYVRKYNKVDNAYEKFLKKVKSFLKKEGHLIIIADNRLALKYFSGSVDEYSRKLFTGIENYQNYSFIKSFDKQELLNLLDTCGLNSRDMYYINSDYYFADKIYTDYALKRVPYKSSKFSTSYNAFSFYDENIVYDSFQKNGIVDRFVDAFIVDCYFTENQNEKIVYYQSGKENNEGIAVVLSKGQLETRVFNDETKESSTEKIGIEDWQELIFKSDVKGVKDKYLKKNIGLPFVDPVEILNFGRKYDLIQKTDAEDSQMVEEENLIQGLIGELYENQ